MPDAGSGGGLCGICGILTDTLFKPDDSCGKCHFGKYNSAHDTAILNVAGYLMLFQPKGGGEVTMDLSASQGFLGRNSKNRIQGGSPKNPGLEPGYADLIYWTDDAVYVWDAKHAGGSAEAGGKKEVGTYVKYLQKQLKKSGDARVVKPGFSFMPMESINYKKPNELVSLRPSRRSSSVIAYKMKELRPSAPPATSEEPEAESEGVMNGIREWWHENVSNHDWSTNPWTPKSPFGGPFPMPPPIVVP